MNYIYGLVPVLEAMRAQKRRILKIYLLAGAQQSRLDELTTTAKKSRIILEKRDRKSLDELTNGANHQGVVAVLDQSLQYKNLYTDADEILDSLSDTPLLVLLDGIEDPHNLGAILRVCEGAGVDGVFIPDHRAASLNETTAKTSAGAVEYVRIAKVTNLVPLIDQLKDRGVWIVGAEGNGDSVYTEFDFKVPLAIVMGSEGKGIRRLVRERCDAIVSIPMNGHLNSLNVSVATGIVLFEILRQRRSS